MADLRSELLKSFDIAYEDYNLNGTKVLIRELTGENRARILGSMPEGDMGFDQIDKLSVDMVIACVCDPETKKPVFKRRQDEAVLRKKSPRVLQEITEIAMRLSGISKEEAETARKNS